MKLIQGFNINESNLPALSSTRTFRVDGELGAEFMLQVFNTASGSSDPVDFYDFLTGSFSPTFTSTSNLNVKMSGDTYNGSITFPADASGNTYTILLLVGASEDTELNFSNNRKSYVTTISQVANTTLTFTPTTTNTSDYTSWSSGDNVTCVTIPETAISILKTLDWTLTNASTDANGFGLRLTRQPIDTDWYFTSSDTVNNRLDDTIEAISNIVNGAVSEDPNVTLLNPWYESAGGSIKVGDYVFLTGGGSVTLGTTVAGTLDVDSPNALTLSAGNEIHDEAALEFITATNKVILDDLTDIVAGMVISAVSGTNAYLIGTPTVTSVDADTNTITLSEVQAFVDGVALTFQARGSAAIKEAIGADVDFTNWKTTVTSAAANELTKTVRTTSTGTSEEKKTVDLNGTYGISGGSVVSVSGRGFKNTSANTVQTVSASSSSGSIVMQVSQDLNSGTKLTFSGSTQSIDIDNTFVVKTNPSANRIINLNIDNFITPGVSGS